LRGSEVASRALNGFSPRLMVTDPPYGVRYDPGWRRTPRLHPGVVSRAKLAVGKVLNDDRAYWGQAWAHFPGDVAYVWHSALHHGTVERGLNAVAFVVRAQIVWDKGRVIISRGAYHWRHEPCLYAVRKGRTAGWTGDRRQVTVWPIANRRNETGHAAQKPVECMARPMLNHSIPGDAVYDPFVGSGTTIIAAEQTGRVCLAIELNPDYCRMAIERWEQMTGRRAEIEA
jgi:DNA modification methylase